MTATDRYLAELQRELTEVDPVTREELVRGIREELTGLGEAEAEVRMRELGDPAFVAASARAEASAPSPRRRDDTSWYSVVTVLLASIGGFLVPVLGWLLGLVMLWMAASWELRHKVVGTLLTVVGPVGAGLLLLPAYSTGEVAAYPPSDQVNPLLPEPVAPPWAAITISLVLALAWVAGWIWLLVAAERARRR